MELLGYLLYPIMALILYWMWSRVRGLKLEQIVQLSADEHHRINDVFSIHPKGGDWARFEKWMKEIQH